MADRARIINFSPGGRPITILDVNDGVTYAFDRDGFDLVPADAKQVFSETNRRFGGARIANEMHSNASINMRVVVGCTPTLLTSDQVALAGEALLTALEDLTPNRYFEWRPEGATRSVYYELRGPGPWKPNYRWLEMSGRMLRIDISVAMAPLALGDALDINDPFTVNSITDYTFDASTASDVTVDTANGLLKPLVGAALTVERRFFHSFRGYTQLDGEFTIKCIPGATITNSKWGRTMRRSASNTYIDVYVDDNGVNSRLNTDVVIVGVRTNRAQVNLAARIANGVPFWVTGRVEHGTVVAEHWTSPPTPLGTPTTRAPTGSDVNGFPNAYLLTSSEATSLVAGNAGVSWIPQDAAAAITNYDDGPYMFKAINLPESLQLKSVPGDAPALLDLDVTHSGGAAAPVYGAFGWLETPPMWNHVWNGDFEANVNGWSVAAGFLNAAATSITRDTSAFKFGTANGQVVCPATTNTGASFRMYGRFRKGVTYTAEMWVRSAAQTTSAIMKVGHTLTSAQEGAASNLSATFTLRTCTWTPTIDVWGIDIAFAIQAATATTFQMDGVRVYEGTTAPTTLTQLEGRGAAPPLGVLYAGSTDPTDLAGSGGGPFTLGGTGANGTVLLQCTPAAAGSAAATWFVDPSLMTPDDFTLGEVAVEVWARVFMDGRIVTPLAILSAIPEYGSSFGAERFTDEWGTVGTLLTVPSGSNTGWRIVRLGIIKMNITTTAPIRWKMKLQITWGASTAGANGLALDYFVLLPGTARISGATAKANDASYPDLFTSTSETTKRIYSDLSVWASKPPNNFFPDTPSLGGFPLEIPTGNVDLVGKVSSLVPDDPTSDATTEQALHNIALRARIRPRYWLMRGN